MPELYQVVNTTLVNPVVGSLNLATGEVEYDSYGYQVNLGSAIFFTVFFALSTLLHTYQAIHYKLWWLLWTLSLGGLGETIGWAGRLWSSRSFSWVAEEGGYWTSSNGAIVTLIFCPAFLAAANYLILGLLIAKHGIQFSRLTPRMYLGLFVTADIFSLAIQSLGGGIAAGSQDDPKAQKRGSDIAMAGIFLQLAAMLVFTGFLIEFSWRFFKERPITGRAFAVTVFETTDQERKNAKLLIVGVSIANFLIFVRSLFRAIEFAQGWGGAIYKSEPLFCIFDGTLILLSLYTLNVLHPGRLVGAVRIPRRREFINAGETPMVTEDKVESQKA
ncbi:RTA1 like protein-domain-containing protein [Mrakia frigida]|uniref:RTA1 domain-containing protein n=1 Tax=Mrakia frigida TaxID=29902 RepID=UPI003FCC0B88